MSATILVKSVPTQTTIVFNFTEHSIDTIHILNSKGEILEILDASELRCDDGAYEGLQDTYAVSTQQPDACELHLIGWDEVNGDLDDFSIHEVTTRVKI